MSHRPAFDPVSACRRPLAFAALAVALLPAHAQYDSDEGPGGPLMAMPRIEVRPAETPPEDRARLLGNTREAVSRERRPAPAAGRGGAANREPDTGDRDRLVQNGQARPRTSP